MAMLEIDHLYKSYGRFQAVSDLTLHIPEGDLFGFVGPNGAGKTTTIRITCGLLSASSGSVKVNGVDAIRDTQNIKRMIGYVPDFFGVYDNFKVREYMEFYGSMYGMTLQEISQLTDDLLELVNLADKKEVYVDTLSRGMKQRLCVARALLHNPALLILDEPSSGLDPRARVEMKELLKNLNSMGKTIIISSHILSELSEMCNSIGIMNKGHLMAAGKIEDIMQSLTNQNKTIISVLGDMNAALMTIQEFPNIRISSVLERDIVVQGGTDEELNRLLYQLLQKGILLQGFHKEEGNLETLFMQLTGEEEKHEN